MTPEHDPIYDPGVTIWTNLNPDVLRMLHMKYHSSDIYCSQEEDFLNIWQICPLFAPSGAPWWQCPFILTNLNPHFPNDTSCQVWLNLVYWFLRRSCLKEKVELCSGELKKVEYKWMKRNLIIKLSKITFTQICTKWKCFW